MSWIYSTRSINPKMKYTYKEITVKLKVNIRTVQRMHKQGLKVLDPNIKPYLVSGADLIEFMKQIAIKAKTKLKENELYCVKCRTGRTGKPGSVEFKETGKAISNNAKQVIIKAVCEKCGTRISRFSSDKKIVNFKNSLATNKNREERLVHNTNPSLVADIEEGTNE